MPDPQLEKYKAKIHDLETRLEHRSEEFVSVIHVISDLKREIERLKKELEHAADAARSERCTVAKR